MSLYKWVLKILVGIDLQDPLEALAKECNDAEEYLLGVSTWPQKISGRIYLIDSTGDDEYKFFWAIGEVDDSRFNDSILVEFDKEVLVGSGIAYEQMFPDTLKLCVNPPIKEYFQVTKVEKI
ncbi:MAG TPA: hypothetical protein ENJ80_10445 [Gammaproteobacteria bacterium]|nr:hypothetical protein [Gammaproteobacteria bacterium]